MTGLSHPWGVAVYGSHLYFTDRDFEVIERVDKTTGTNRVVLRDNVSGLRVLKVHYRESELPKNGSESSFLFQIVIDFVMCLSYRIICMVQLLQACLTVVPTTTWERVSRSACLPRRVSLPVHVPQALN